MVVYDKAAWHIDGMLEPEAVVDYFRRVFKWLADNEMLSTEGRETYDSGIDDSISLHDRLVTKEAKEFLDSKYDTYLENHFEDDADCDELNVLYQDFLRAKGAFR